MIHSIHGLSTQFNNKSCTTSAPDTYLGANTSRLATLALSPRNIIRPIPRILFTRIRLQLDPPPHRPTRLDLFPPPRLPTQALDRFDLVPPLGGHHVGQVGPAVSMAVGRVEGDVNSVGADGPVERVTGGLEGGEE